MGTEKNSSKTARVMSLLGKGSDRGNPVLGAVSDSDTTRQPAAAQQVVRWMALPPVSDSDTGRAPK